VNEIRTVTLELLRHGSPHNQLLSPLTEYLALCGNYPAVTVRLPFEHQQLVVRLNAMSYQDSQDTRRLQLVDTARLLAQVLSEVPGLIAELSDSTGTGPPLTHLRLIQSASELALVPFELAVGPEGFPGAGQPLVLQSQSPLCVTREMRSSVPPNFQWPREPRILFAAAAPPGFDPVPLEAHLLALRRAIDPWVEKQADGRARAKEIKEHLRVIPRATVGSILDACRAEKITHLHILAHGARVPGRDESYGLVLHKDGDPGAVDIIDGSRLSPVFRTYQDRGSFTLFSPTVVTIAACEGANQGSVLGAGSSSVAHALHTAGIPLVVASQFPLSYAGSVLLTEVLYDGLWRTKDPRMLLNDLRWQLKARFPDTHDWASLVAYAALPADLSEQFEELRVTRAYDQFVTAMSYLSRVTGSLLGSPVLAAAEARKRRRQATKMLQTAVKRFRELLEDTPLENADQRATLYELLGMADKWYAKILYSREAPDQRPQAAQPGRIRSLLTTARHHYSLSSRIGPGTSYAVVQELALAAVLEGADVATKQWWSDKWVMARVRGENALDHPLGSVGRSLLDFGEELSDLLELYLLGLLLPAPSQHAHFLELAKENGRRLVRDYADQFPDLLEGTRDQLGHYTDWYNIYNPTLQRLAQPAQELIDLLST